MEFEGFAKDVVRFERKKLILPVLMLVILISAVTLGSHLRAQEVDEELIENSQQEWENGILIFAENHLYNQSIDESIRERQQRADDKLEKENQEIMNRPIVKSGALLFVVYESNLYPLLPSSLTSKKDDSLLFKKSDGYFMTEAYPAALAERLYLRHRISNLHQEINNSRDNWTLGETRQAFDDITSVEYPDDRILTHLKNSNDSKLVVPTGINTESRESWREPIVENNIKEVQFYHFIPSAVLTFIIYYLLSGLLLEVFRVARTKV